ncbi:autotransporter domain-containing protein [Chondromyces crocatus]|uniref:Uncharacterized protein n=1 Tax=Chondromyces crocatus TaxID=52 RepID=A0A0K1EE69_CHOCO|nr:autotransporter domain-containing protein [Chondromyces crocatus]AKT39160.1 uncharacterized protein CMC5_033070 [Chondromyces crocatus]
MNATFGIAFASAALTVAAAGTALAQPVNEELRPTYLRSPVRAPVNAAELGIDVGYTQGFGDIASGSPVSDTAGAGLGVGLGIGYRAVPSFGFGLYSQYQNFTFDTPSARTRTEVHGMTAGAQATFHLLPYQRIDPHLTVGAGYRMLWRIPEGGLNDNTLTHGFQIARVNLGLDMRLSDSVAIGPMIGADLTMFMWENPEGPRGDRLLEDRSLSTFVYAGMQGRFDMGGYRATQMTAISRR